MHRLTVTVDDGWLHELERLREVVEHGEVFTWTEAPHIALGACQFCGSDDASVETCLDCIAPSVGHIARALGSVLGGGADVWNDIAAAVARELGA